MRLLILWHSWLWHCVVSCVLVTVSGELIFMKETASSSQTLVITYEATLCRHRDDNNFMMLIQTDRGGLESNGRETSVAPILLSPTQFHYKECV
jgi:hypothetical protein